MKNRAGKAASAAYESGAGKRARLAYGKAKAAYLDAKTGRTALRTKIKARDAYDSMKNRAGKAASAAYTAYNRARAVNEDKRRRRATAKRRRNRDYNYYRLNY